MIALYLLLVLLVIAIIFLSCKIQAHKRNYARIIEYLSKHQHELIETRKRDTESRNLEHFSKTLDAIFKADSSLIYQCVKKSKKDDFSLFHVSGILKERLAKSTEIEVGIRKALDKNFIYSSRAHMLSTHELSELLPASTDIDGCCGVAVALRIPGKAYYIILIRNNSTGDFTNIDLTMLDFWSGLLEKELLSVEIRIELDKAKDDLQKAQEQGMIQVSSGIIHNIGNSLTVLQMQMKHLVHHRQIRELSEFLRKEVIPVIQSHEKDGTLLEFLKTDPKGKVYLEVIGESLNQISSVSLDFGENLDKSLNMFSDILEVINLQHQFIGELGTENIVSIETIIRDAVLMSQSVIAENRIELIQKINSRSSLLVDPALLKHISILNIKYAVESINKASRSKPVICIGSVEEVENGNLWIVLEISDNGYGIEFTPEGEDQRSRDLRFCSERIAKYGGKYNVEFNQGYGSVITIRMPGYQYDNK